MTYSQSIKYVINTSKKKNWNIDRNDVDDIVQNAYVEALSKAVAVEEKAFIGFLVISMLRFIQKRGKSKISYVQNKELNRFWSFDSIDQDLEKQEDIEAMMSFVDRLPEYLKRDVKALLSGMTTKQIAAINEMPRQTVSVNICRAKLMLADLMKNHR